MTLIIENEAVPLRIDGSGVVRVGKTRVLIDLVVQAFNEGATAEEIMQMYPSLPLADIYLVIGYYLKHRTDVDAYLQERAERGEEMRKRIQANNDMTGIRERLLSRRNGNENTR